MNYDYKITFGKTFSKVKEKIFERYVNERYIELISSRINKQYENQEVKLFSDIQIYPRGGDIYIDVTTQIQVNGMDKGKETMKFTTTYQDAIGYLILDLFKEMENA